MPITGRRSHRRLLCLLAAALIVSALLIASDFNRRDAPHVPTYGLMLKPFGEPVDYQECGFHTGQDWFAPIGMPVFATRLGTVMYVGPLWLSGKGVGRGEHAIVLDHGSHYSTYSHLSKALVEPGELIGAGQKIGEVGAEGFSRGPHLHLEWIEKAKTPWTGNWRVPFRGCDGYAEPGDRWRWFGGDD